MLFYRVVRRENKQKLIITSNKVCSVYVGDYKPELKEFKKENNLKTQNIEWTKVYIAAWVLTESIIQGRKKTATKCRAMKNVC